MRYMLLIYPNVPTEAGWMPSPEAVAAMSRYNEELSQAGVLLALDGFHPGSEGARVVFGQGSPQVADVPTNRDTVGGYWIIQVDSKQAAVDWAKRAPIGGDAVIEVRRVFEIADFPEDVQAAAELSQLPREQPAARWRP